MNTEEIDSALKGLTQDDTVPTWAKILIKCFRNLVSERGVADDLDKRISVLEKRMISKDDENRILKIQMAGLRDELEELEQYGRRNCLVFHGITEKKGESTTDEILKVIYDQLLIPEGKVSPRDIGRSHRLGKPLNKNERTTRSMKERTRPIIVRFKGYDSRSEVFAAKRKLKGSNIMVTENLTAKRYNLLKKCLTKLGKGNVWTYDGRITTIINNSYVVIKNEFDLAKL